MAAKTVLRSLSAALVVGIGLSLALTHLLGYVAAVAFPRWYVVFAEEHIVLALLVWEVLTKVPVIVAISAIFGLLLSRLATGRYFSIGFLAVLFSLVVAVMLYPIDGDYMKTARYYALPSSVLHLPAFLALYFSLPWATRFFGQRISVAYIALERTR